MSLEIAKEFAILLDNNQFDEASLCMAENCEYHYFEGDYRGRENIISLYRQHHEHAIKILDEVNYSSEVSETEDGNYRILFIDKIRKGHKWHEYRCHQIVRFGNNQIVSILHSEIPGEIESLKMFYSRSVPEKLILP
ncbi:MAG: hypothetical protein ACHQM6_00930 [Candidatus Kapaibacterium sp.]